jgi:hypothetical protein
MFCFLLLSLPSLLFISIVVVTIMLLLLLVIFLCVWNSNWLLSGKDVSAWQWAMHLMLGAGKWQIHLYHCMCSCVCHTHTHIGTTWGKTSLIFQLNFTLWSHLCFFVLLVGLSRKQFLEEIKHSSSLNSCIMYSVRVHCILDLQHHFCCFWAKYF